MERGLRKKLEEEYYLFGIDAWAWEETYAFEQLTTHFQTNSLSGFGLEKGSAGAIAAGAVLHHLKRSEYSSLDHIASISRISLDDFMWLTDLRFPTLNSLRQMHQGARRHWTL